MKKALLVAIVVSVVLIMLLGSVFAQKKTDLSGTWIGFAIVEGAQIEMKLVLEKKEGVYTGTLSDTSGMVPETEIKNTAFKDDKFSFEFDFANQGGTIIIKIEMTLQGDTMKGNWTDPEGSSDIVELTKQK